MPSFEWSITSDAEKDFVRIARQKRKFNIYRAGWPDFLVHDPATDDIFGVEVKCGSDPLRKSQLAMFSMLERLNVKIFVWHPSRRTVLTPWRKFYKFHKDYKPTALSFLKSVGDRREPDNGHKQRKGVKRGHYKAINFNGNSFWPK